MQVREKTVFFCPKKEGKIMKKDTICRLCSSCCPIRANVENGKLISAKRKSFLPPEKQISCPKLKAASEIVYSSDRITTPLIRNNHGSGFREASWDEALQIVTEKFNFHREKDGAKSVAWLRGMAADWGSPWDYPNRLMNLFGSPNTIGNGSICFVARDMAHTMVYGSMAFPEAKNSECILIWGKNDRNTTLGIADAIIHAKEKGAKLIVIDPVQTTFAQQADIWLQIKPGHDGILAMAMIHEIISQNLHDQDFIANHTVGFEQLAEAAAAYPAEEIAEKIWLSAEEIKAVAHMYATAKPACIVDGNGLDMHMTVFEATRAIAFLRALTGNLDKSGGDVLPQPVPLRNIQMKDSLPSDVTPITDKFDLFNNFNATWGNQVQGCVVDAILDQTPYGVKMVVVQSGNPVITMADSHRTRKAFEQLESLVVIDMFMTETAKLADVILPASSCFEKTQLNRSSIRNNPIILQNSVIEPIGDSWPDWMICFELARKLGFHKEFPWETAEEAINYQLEPLGIDVNLLHEHPDGYRLEEIRYSKYEDQPLQTPTGKVEFYSASLKESGFSAVPDFSGELENPIAFADQEQDYPMLGVSGSRDIRFTNSQFRTISSLLQERKGCVVDIHPIDAEKFDIFNKDTIKISSPKGEIMMDARISKVTRPGVVRIGWGWGDLDPQCNFNNLTADDKRNPITGTSTSRSFMCKIEKVG
jgi:thiosulfate reductase / polysulfide reductase chain A